MKKISRQFMAILLAAAMMVTLVPMSAIAADAEVPEETAVEAAEAPAEIPEDAEAPAETEAPAPAATAEEAAPVEEAAPAAEAEAEAEVTAPVEQPAAEAVEEPAPEVQEEASVAMPAQSFKDTITEKVKTSAGTGKKKKTTTTNKQVISVDVKAPEGAFPEGTTMSIKKVGENDKVAGKKNGKTYREAIEGAAGSEVNSILAVDITFTCDGKEVEPAKPISVVFKSDALNAEDGQALSIVHVADDGTAAVIEDADIDEAKQEATFDADSFSVYAIVASVIIEEEEGSFEFETDEYQIAVSYTKEAKIPLGTELTVSEIPVDSKEYNDLWNQSLTKLNEGVDKTVEGPGGYKGIAAAAFFDISLMLDGKEFEPEVPLQVEITFKKGGLPQFAGEETKIIHFGAKGTELIEDVEVGKSSQDLPKGMPEGILTDSYTYMQDGFSKVGVLTTDDVAVFADGEVVVTKPINAKALLAAGTRAAGDTSINAGKTVTDTDGDGIYELALSVNATSKQSSTTDVTKSNIVLVIDVSGSMNFSTFEEYTYSADTYNSSDTYYNSTSVDDDGVANGRRVYYNTTGGYWYYINNSGQQRTYNGTVYHAESRLAATKRAANAVVDALLAYNENDDNITDIFEISVVKFAQRTASGTYNGTQEIVSHSTNATTIKNAINNLNPGGGTHWRAALEQALTSANWYKNNQSSDEKTSVIFLTDGFPTEYGTGNDGGQETDYNISRSFSDAIGPARNIVSAGYMLYNIFAYGNETTHGNTSGTYNTGRHTGFEFLRGLANYAYGSGSNVNYGATEITNKYCFNAKSTSDLVNAFKTIIDHITNSVGYAGVNLSDGVSLGATSTSVAVNGTAKEETMRYTVTDADGKISYTVKFSSSGAATFTIYNADGTTTTQTVSSSENVTTTINGTTITSKVYTATVGSGDDAKTYKMSPATIDPETGMVKWDLAGLGILESGYTYTVAFDVWANQLAYDIAADLNNGIYTTVEEALDAYNVTDSAERQHIKDAIVHNADGSYSLYTNYEQSVEYYPATSQTNDAGETTWTYGDKETQELPHPDPIPLKGSRLPLKKIWESELSETELNELLWENGEVGGTSKEYKITLHVWKADTEAELDTMVNTGVTETNKPYVSKELGWDAESRSYVFEKSAAVAPGVMVNIEEAAILGFDTTDATKIKTFEGRQYYVIESGHYYYVTEEGSDLHYELNTVLYHPMVVDGTLYNVFFGEGQTVEKMDPMVSVLATNTLKGGLNIMKVASTTPITVNGNEITGFTEPVKDGVKTVTDEFTFEIKLWKVDEDGQKSAVYTYDDQIKDSETISGSIGYRIFSEPSMVDGAIVYGTQARGAVLTADSPYADLAGGIFATIDNNETTITLTMPANGEIRLVNLPSGTKYTVKEIVDTTGNYTYAATASQVKKSDTDISDPVVTTGNTVSGTVSGNSASMETYYNWASSFYVYHSSDNTIEKISFADERVQSKYENGKYTYTFNIVDEVKTSKDEIPSYLYGGYYMAYGGQVKTDTEIKALTYDENGWAADDSTATPYTGSKATAWKKANAYTEKKGTEMSPVLDTVYYLKEVPNAYLRPYIQVVFDEVDNNTLKKLYRITAVDDANYTQVGFFDGSADSSSTSLSATIKITKGSTTQTLTPKGVFNGKSYPDDDSITLPRGYLTSIENAYTSNFAMQPYFITLDGVKVFGITNRTVNPGNGTFVDDGTGAGKLPGITAEDLTNVLAVQ